MQPYGKERHADAVAEYPLVITRAEAETGTQRTISFHGPDGVERTLAVDIPAGSGTGARLPVAFPDAFEGQRLAYGELVVVLTVVPHWRSECRGADLYITLQADRASAERDGEVRLQLADGRVLAVPIQPGMTHNRFVYAGQGLLRGYAPLRYGDLILRLELLETAPPQPATPRPATGWWRSLFGDIH